MISSKIYLIISVLINIISVLSLLVANKFIDKNLLAEVLVIISSANLLNLITGRKYYFNTGEVNNKSFYVYLIRSLKLIVIVYPIIFLLVYTYGLNRGFNVLTIVYFICFKVVDILLSMSLKLNIYLSTLIGKFLNGSFLIILLFLVNINIEYIYCIYIVLASIFTLVSLKYFGFITDANGKETNKIYAEYSTIVNGFVSNLVLIIVGNLFGNGFVVSFSIFQRIISFSSLLIGNLLNELFVLNNLKSNIIDKFYKVNTFLVFLILFALSTMVTLVCIYVNNFFNLEIPLESMIGIFPGFLIVLNIGATGYIIRYGSEKFLLFSEIVLGIMKVFAITLGYMFEVDSIKLIIYLSILSVIMSLVTRFYIKRITNKDYGSVY